MSNNVSFLFVTQCFYVILELKETFFNNTVTEQQGIYKLNYYMRKLILYLHKQVRDIPLTLCYRNTRRHVDLLFQMKFEGWHEAFVTSKVTTHYVLFLNIQFLETKMYRIQTWCATIGRPRQSLIEFV